MSDKPWRNPETIEYLYHKKRLSQQEVADKLGCSRATLQKWSKRYGIEFRSRSESQRIRNLKNPHVPVYIDNEGYEVIKPMYDGKFDFCRVHRLIAVAEYGFEAVCDKEIHHKNNIPWDNRPDNIELVDETGHSLLQSKNKETVDDIPNDYPWKNPYILYQLYYDRELTTLEIADKFSVSDATIRNWMDKFGMERRPSPI